MPDNLSHLLQPDDTAERCGVILASGEALEIENLHPEPENGFRMNMVQVLPHLENVTATWHTHPKGPAELSGQDYSGFLGWPKLTHHIIAPGRTVASYRIEDGVVIRCN